MFSNSVIQYMFFYEKLNVLSKLISKFYIQLHINVGISQSFRWSIFIKFDMEVEGTYTCIYGSINNKSSRSKSRDLSFYVFFYYEKKCINNLATRIAWFSA